MLKWLCKAIGARRNLCNLLKKRFQLCYVLFNVMAGCMEKELENPAWYSFWVIIIHTNYLLSTSNWMVGIVMTRRSYKLSYKWSCAVLAFKILDENWSKKVYHWNANTNMELSGLESLEYGFRWKTVYLIIGPITLLNGHVRAQVLDLGVWSLAVSVLRSGSGIYWQLR